LTDLRRRLRRAARLRRGRGEVRPDAPRPHPPPDRPRRRPGDDAVRTHPGHQARPGQGRPDDRRHRRGGDQRGLRPRGARVDQGDRRRPGPRQPQRRRHRPRPPARRDRRQAVRHPAGRARAHRRPLRPPDHVRGRWHRQRDDHRAAGQLTPHTAGPAPSVRKARGPRCSARRPRQELEPPEPVSPTGVPPPPPTLPVPVLPATLPPNASSGPPTTAGNRCGSAGPSPLTQTTASAYTLDGTLLANSTPGWPGSVAGRLKPKAPGPASEMTSCWSPRARTIAMRSPPLATAAPARSAAAYGGTSMPMHVWPGSGWSTFTVTVLPRT